MKTHSSATPDVHYMYDVLETSTCISMSSFLCSIDSIFLENRTRNYRGSRRVPDVVLPPSGVEYVIGSQELPHYF